MPSRFLPDELMYYQWSVARWRTSVTRETLDATGRGIFRELLDSAYTQGSIPRDPEILCRIAGCTRQQFDTAWEVIGRHFVAHRSDPNLLVGRHAEVYRKQYFSRLKDKRTAGSRGGRPPVAKSVADKSSEISEMETSRFSGEKPSGFPPENLKEKEKKEKEKEEKERTPQPPKGGEVEVVRALAFDEQWQEFRSTAVRRNVLPGSNPEWANAAHAWRTLDFEQRAAAVRDVSERDADSPVLKSLPANYLRDRKWERPELAARPRAPSSPAMESRMRAAVRFAQLVEGGGSGEGQ